MAELIDIVRLLGACAVIGGDLVEVAHAWDPSGRTGIAASWVIREAILSWWGSLARSTADTMKARRQAREYTAPRLYEIAFDLNRRAEVDFLVQCFRTYARGPVRRVLDIACGTGPHLMRLAARGYHMAGLDLSRRNIEFLRQRLAAKGYDG